jgi:hypothetical protein
MQQPLFVFVRLQIQQAKPGMITGLLSLTRNPRRGNDSGELYFIFLVVSVTKKYSI